MLLDFFLDEEENLKGATLTSLTEKSAKPAPAAAAAASPPPPSPSGGANDVTPAMDAIKKMISPELVKKVNGVYSFVISDANPGEWYLDLKNGNGQLAAGKFEGQSNCTLTMKAEIFNKMVSGAMKPTSAFMSGKLRIKGDMGLAMKLEKLMGSLKSKL